MSFQVRHRLNHRPFLSLTVISHLMPWKRHVAACTGLH